MRNWLRGSGVLTAATALALSVPQSSAAAETMMGCLEKTDSGFALTAAGKRSVVIGSVDLEKHAGHTVRITGEESGDAFRATNLEHVSPTCDSSTSSSRSSAARNSPDAMDQGSSEADIEMTAKIRRALVDDDGLSISAQNITVVTRDGKVTLRGDVRSAQEKSAVAAKAQAAAGVTVDNQLTVKPESDQEDRQKRGEK